MCAAADLPWARGGAWADMPTRRFGIRISYALGAACIAMGCGVDSSGSPSLNSVSGTILSRVTRQPIEGGLVEVTDGADVGKSATSDGLGRFQLSGLVSPAFPIRVRHPSFQEELQSVGDNESSIVIALRPLPCEAATCGRIREPSACNAALPLLRRPFVRAGRMINAFDHHFPEGFARQDGLFTSYCGAGGTYDGHDGYDWFMLEGSPVLAAANGTVTRAGAEDPFFCPLLGRTTAANVIAIDHVAATGERYRTQYLHLSRILVAVGQPVTAGQEIGESGNTGCSLGPHLHFGVYRFGVGIGPPTVVDPYGWQGAGEDPWASHSRGAYSPWLWIDAPEFLSGGGQILDARGPLAAW